jgi:WD40 repeat protein
LTGASRIRPISTSTISELRIEIWDSQTGQASLTLTDPSSKITAFTHDGSTVFTGHDNGEIKLWDLATGRQTDALRGHRGAVRTIRVENDRRRGLQRMVTRVGEEVVQLWDLKTSRVISTFSESGIQNLGSAVNGEWFWTLVDGKTVKFRDMANGRAIGAITELGNEILTAGSLSRQGDTALLGFLQKLPNRNISGIVSCFDGELRLMK